MNSKTITQTNSESNIHNLMQLPTYHQLQFPGAIAASCRSIPKVPHVLPLLLLLQQNQHTLYMFRLLHLHVLRLILRETKFKKEKPYLLSFLKKQRSKSCINSKTRFACLARAYHVPSYIYAVLLSIPPSPHVRPHPMEAFYAQWIIEEERLLNDLLLVPADRPDLHIPLISQMLSHCAAYYSRKSQLAERDIFQAFSAYWLTPIERSFLWLGGLKPGMIFHFVPSGLNNAQWNNIEQLRMQMLDRQTELEVRMRQVEEAMTVLMALAAVHGHVRNGEARGEATLRVAEMLRAVFDEADRLRKHVVTTIIEILNTAQTVHFLAAAVNFHLTARRYGLHHGAS